jgi:phosphonopyruvate decarboxylase
MKDEMNSLMVAVDEFNECLLSLELNYFTGVPDSTLKEWLKSIFDDDSRFVNRIAANEGAAISNAAGYYLATGNIGVVYLQNSGLGNCVNPLTSLTDSEVYGVPMLMLIGWRGGPGKKDEPQHKKMGAITEKILITLDIPYEIIDNNNYERQIHDAVTLSRSNQQPCALIVKPGFFSRYNGVNGDRDSSINSKYMSREDAIKCIVDTVKSHEIILSTTGKTSRELYEVCAYSHRGHNNNFYNVGSMGHVSAIGLEVSLQKKDRITYIFDGDGALIMHMGTLASIGYYQPSNLVHIVFDNEVHESTGDQSTLSSAIDISGVMRMCNYKQVLDVSDKATLVNIFNSPIAGPLGVVIKIKAGSRNNLGRPNDTPKETKIRFMNWNN